MYLSYVVGMRDIIWQQHSSVVVNSFQEQQRALKFSACPAQQYDQPERIHFVSSVGTHLNSIQVGSNNSSNLKKLNLVHSNISNSSIDSNSSSEISGSTSSGKWSVVIDDNQNPKV